MPSYLDAEGTPFQRFEHFVPFLRILCHQNVNLRQSKAILTHVSRDQRLAIGEIITNIYHGHIPMDDTTVMSLVRYMTPIRKIATMRRKVDNLTLSRHSAAVLHAMKIALAYLTSSPPDGANTPAVESEDREDENSLTDGSCPASPTTPRDGSHDGQ